MLEQDQCSKQRYFLSHEDKIFSHCFDVVKTKLLSYGKQNNTEPVETRYYFGISLKKNCPPAIKKSFSLQVLAVQAVFTLQL